MKLLYFLLVSTLTAVGIADPVESADVCVGSHVAITRGTEDVELPFTPLPSAEARETPLTRFLPLPQSLRPPSPKPSEKTEPEDYTTWVNDAVKRTYGTGVKILGKGLEKTVFEVEDGQGRWSLMVPREGREGDFKKEEEVLQAARTADPVGSQFLLPAPKPTPLTYQGRSVPALRGFLASEGNLRSQLAELGPTTPADKMLRLWKQMAMGLRAVHRTGKVHRDIKPENFLMHREGPLDLVFLSDFGSAVEVEGPDAPRPKTVRGTPGFMSRGMMNGDPASVRHDLFGLRNTMMEMILGTDLLSLDFSKIPKSDYSKTGRLYVHLNRIPDAYRAEIDPVLLRLMDEFSLDASGEVQFASVDRLIERLESAIAESSGPTVEP